MNRNSSLFQAMRKLKRALLTGGHSVHVWNYLADLEAHESQLSQGQYYLNLSFDLEHSFNGCFWRGEFEKSFAQGRVSKRIFREQAQFFKEKSIPYNVQVVGALFDSEHSYIKNIDPKLLDVIQTHPELFEFDEEEKELLRSSNLVLGTHGFSHRTFDQFSDELAAEEYERSIDIIESSLKRKVEYMSFPRNKLPSEKALMNMPLLKRNDHQGFSSEKRIHPKGLWHSPTTLSPEELSKVLDKISQSTPQHFLHLWSHFREFELSQLKEYVDVVEASSFQWVSSTALPLSNES